MSEFRRRLIYQTTNKEIPGGIPVDNAPDGYYIYADNKLFTYNEWNKNNNDKVIGLAVINSTHPKGGFIIATKTHELKLVWSNNNIFINNLVETDGQNNTLEIIKQDSGAEAAIFCNNYIFPNGQTGYLPSIEEFEMINKKTDFLNCITAVNASILASNHWTSTQYNTNIAAVILFVPTPGGGGSSPERYKNEQNYVLPFAPLKH